MLKAGKAGKDWSLGKLRLVQWHPFPLWGWLPTWSHRLLKPAGSMHQLVRAFRNTQSPALQRDEEVVLCWSLVVNEIAPPGSFPGIRVRAVGRWDFRVRLPWLCLSARNVSSSDSGFTPSGFKCKSEMWHLLTGQPQASCTSLCCGFPICRMG